MAETPEELVRELRELLSTGDLGPMYKGWGADQDKLVRLKLSGDGGLYAEPWDRGANGAKKENEEILKRILMLFGSLNRDRANDGLKDILAQQNAGADVADVVAKLPDKYRSAFQEFFSGEGSESFEADLKALIDKRARAYAAKMREDEERKEREERDRKEREEREERDRKEREERDRKEREERDKIEAEKARLAKEREDKEHEAKTLAEENAALKQELQTLKAQLATPFGSRNTLGAPVPGGANAAGVLNPNVSMPDQARQQALSQFVLEAQSLLTGQMGDKGDPARSESIRQDLFNASLAYKQGGVPTLRDPDLKALATKLGLPHGFGADAGGMS